MNIAAPPEDFSTDVFNIEHVVPLSQAGTSSDENLAYSCEGCNANKHYYTTGTDPETGTTVPLFHPRNNAWEEHFSWSEGLVGLTPTGRATISLLQMNRPGLVNLRKALLAYGAHPDRDL